MKTSYWRIVMFMALSSSVMVVYAQQPNYTMESRLTSMSITERVSCTGRLDLEVDQRSSGIELAWEAEHPIVYEGFEVERSGDGRSWIQLAFIEGKIESALTQQYSHFDNAPIVGYNYYRLRQWAMDGSFTYSRVVVANTIVGDVASLHVFPNPVDEVLQYEFVTPDATSGYDVELYQQSGQCVRHWRAKQGAKEQLDLVDLANGTYVLVITTNSRRYQQWFVKQ